MTLRRSTFGSKSTASACKGSTSDMVFGAVGLVSYISRFMSLQAGDIISTGTPAGVGHGLKPPVYLKAGDVMKLGIAGLGIQTQRVQAYSAVSG